MMHRPGSVLLRAEIHGPVCYPGLDLLPLSMGCPAHTGSDCTRCLPWSGPETADLPRLHAKDVVLVFAHACLQAAGRLGSSRCLGCSNRSELGHPGSFVLISGR